MEEITRQVVLEHGLKDDEYEKILEILGREPNYTELGIFSVMWSEHCSYKSSKKWLKTLPTEAPWVICGPGENAGVVDIGDGLSVIFKMESHNHPSFIEPYQGAATGVGGILRDVFTMGARPFAILNALRFGSPENPKTRHLLSGVVRGIGGYGNCVGVPTVGGECEFHKSFDGNNLVNAMAVGLAKSDSIFYSAAKGAGNPIVYVGSRTGRDGIHGATMASSDFNEDAEEKKPTVQVGDPFTEKLLIEACLELMDTKSIVAIQDMGAAGLTSSSFEMAAKGGVGLEINIDKIPAREKKMTAYEFLLSESQERMLMVIKPGSEGEARKVFEKWGLDFSVIGSLDSSGRMKIMENKKLIADLPIEPLVSKAPEYDRPWEKPISGSIVKAEDIPEPDSVVSVLKTLLGSSDLCSKRWIWEQYDYLVMGKTIQAPGGDAAVVGLEGTKKAVAMTTDCTPRYCLADPFEGAKQAVVEAWRNLISVGAKPLAITDNLNFGNPEKPEIMGEIVCAIKGIGEACRHLNFPVVSGNVSLYNETNGKAIAPTPTIGAVGIIEDYENTITLTFDSEGQDIYQVGEVKGHLGQSLYLREIEGREDGAPPPVDLEGEKVTGEFLKEQINKGNIASCHDISDGGLLIAMVEMALASNLGVRTCGFDFDMPIHAWFFGEDQGRYLICSADSKSFVREARLKSVPIKKVGVVGGHDIIVDGESIALKELRDAHESWLPNLMST